MKKLSALLLSFVGIILLSACGIPKIPVTAIIAQNAIYLNVVSEQNITYIVLPSDASNPKIEMNIDHPTIASLNNGVIRGESVGETTLYLTSYPNRDVVVSITVYVVDQNWPLEDIYTFAGFYLPAISNFTTVLVEAKTDELNLSVKGIPMESLNQVLIDFKDMMVLEGWMVEGTFDTHMALFTHPDYDFDVVMHNDYVHQGDAVELKIARQGSHEHDDHEVTTWEGI